MRQVSCQCTYVAKCYSRSKLLLSSRIITVVPNYYCRPELLLSSRIITVVPNYYCRPELLLSFQIITVVPNYYIRSKLLQSFQIITVVPAEAGIQHFQNPVGMTNNMFITKRLYSVIAELNKGLDSRLRGNDNLKAGLTLC